MKYLVYICITLIILFFTCLYLSNQNFPKENFVGLNMIDPTKPEFTDLKDEWGFPIKDANGDDFYEDENESVGFEEWENENVIDITPKYPDDIIINEEFNEKILSKDYTCENNKFCSNGERICRITLETIYDLPFNNCKLDCLKNPDTKRNLELDCYNEIYKIALEYNGEQHYKYPNSFHKTKEEFIKQIKRDRLKEKLCKENGIYLIIVPYNIQNNIIPSYIMTNLPHCFDDCDENDSKISIY